MKPNSFGQKKADVGDETVQGIQSSESEITNHSETIKVIL
jgi:hypothetical protein